MTKTGRYTRLAGLAGMAMLAMTAPAFAQEIEEVAEEAFTLSAPETAYIFNTLLFLIGGFLVMWMAAVSPAGGVTFRVAAMASWPSRQASAVTGTTSPTTALAGNSRPEIWGRTSSIPSRPVMYSTFHIEGLELPQRA